jgi:soluble lytic murein transglycosylase-like protein
MQALKAPVSATSAAVAALLLVSAGASAKTRTAPQKPAAFHIYVHIPPADTDKPEETKARRKEISEKVETSLKKDAPKDAIKGRIEHPLDGHQVIRWSAGLWTPAQARAKVEAAKRLFKPEDKIKIVLKPVDRTTVELRDPQEIADKLKTDTGAVHEWYRERFGPSFPKDLLTSADGGAVFDFSKVRAGNPGLDSAGVLFDATGQPRKAETIGEMVRLARAKPRAEGTTDPAVKPPPPPLMHDGFVVKAGEDEETQDILRGLIYASRGYGKGFGKRSGLYGPMGLSRATFKWAVKEADPEQRKILEKGIHDDEANILAGAIIFDRLKSQFGGNVSRAVAAFHVGAGNVRKHGGVPANAKHYLGRFQLAHRQGVRRALDPSSPKVARPAPKPEKPVSPIDAIVRRVREESTAKIWGEPPTGRRSSFRNVPDSLVRDIRKEATTGHWRTDPNALIALSEAEGGVNAGTSHANARGVLQITPETAKWECGLSRAELQVRTKNIACAEKVFKRRLDKVDGDIVLAWALYNTKVKWHKIMIKERRVANIKETVRHVTRAAYRYFQLTGDARFDPGTKEFREKYFKSRQALAWSAKSYQDLQRWDRNEGYRGAGQIRHAEKVPGLEGSTVARGDGPSRSGRWRLNSSGTHWYRSSRKAGQRWDIYPYRDRSGRITTPPA